MGGYHTNASMASCPQLEWYHDRPGQALRHLKSALLVLQVTHGTDHPLVGRKVGRSGFASGYAILSQKGLFHLVAACR